jgi:tRNA(His) 5'-end guanylyltransferase
MKIDELEDRMRALERFHSLRLMNGVYPIIRVDGRSFSRLTETQFEKPFDARFHDAMVRTAEALLKETRAIYAYTESDEISLVCPKEWDLFDRELEKIVSITASIAGASFSLAIGAPVAFDSRIVAAVDEDHVVDYFRWRQADAGRCALNGWCYWTLRKLGKNVGEATRTLDSKDLSYKNELLHKEGINFAKLPAWQRRGTGLYWETIEKEGYNPKRKEKVVAYRQRIRVDEDLPAGNAYDQLVRKLLSAPARVPRGSTE